jgi:hypothetical protein
MALSASTAPSRRRASATPRRSVGSKVAIVDQVEEPLDQVVGFLSLGLGECHVIMLPDQGRIRNSCRGRDGMILAMLT